MMKHKTNPRRRPATMADVARAKEKATNDALRLVLYSVMWVLVDKHNASHEELERFNGEFLDVLDSINRGYISWQDIRRTLEEEYGVKLELK